MSGGVRVEAVLLDAYGTLVTLDDPVGRLGALLAADGHPHPADRVAAALRAEVLHYRAHHDEGYDAVSLASLRLRCAAVLAEGLGDDVPPLPRLTEILVDALRFDLLPDALPALDALRDAGLRLGVVSNWDCGLGDVLDGLGVGDRFGVVATSAVVGAGKPDPAIFRHALGALGVEPAAALHCGDLPAFDCAGAAAAGVRAVLIDRAGDRPPDAGRGACATIAALPELLPLAVSGEGSRK
ncbi:MAG: HAD family hydrolase [Thermoleophilia bacterium]